MIWRPASFNVDMVPPILSDDKTETRRPITPQLPVGSVWCNESKLFVLDGSSLGVMRSCPYGNAGDRLWVRERMRVTNIFPPGSEERTKWIAVQYEADGHYSDTIWYPSRLKERPVFDKCLSNGGFREASRISLKVLEVTVERIQDITEDGAMAEGIDMESEHASLCIDIESAGYDNDLVRGSAILTVFRTLFDSIYLSRGYGWTVNPYVWVTKFKRIKGDT